jgi:2,3,4,5-tetrahydropyridine-2-carboxylate N-succinyltransferase
MPLTEAMSAADLERTINLGWEQRAGLTPRSDGPVPKAVMQAVRMMDAGTLRVAEPDGAGGWRVNQWLKQAILLYFRLRRNEEIPGAPGGASWWDKVPMKFAGWNSIKFTESGFRAVPGSFVRYGAFVAPDAVLMPSFINIGAYVGEGTMIDAWATVGSCAQVGRHCHISGGTGIGGVLEPLQAAPVVIEDNVFIGARSEIAEGVRIEKGAVISMGVFIGASTKIVDRNSGEVFQGRVPAGAVVVPGTLPGRPMADGTPGPGLSCAVIVKRVDEQTRAKTSLNELLRD